jgi:hypothetical protein
VHVAADSAYICTGLRGLPAGVTLTGPLPRHASLYQVHPELDYPPARGRQRGRPRTRGPRIGTPAGLAAAGPGRTAPVTRYGSTAAVTICERRCLWPGVFRSRPVRVIAVTEPGNRLVLLTTNMATPAGQVIARYAGRRAIEVAIGDARNITGADEARNRRPRAVERTVPFALFIQSIVIIWYHLAGHSPAITRGRRDRAPWYATKTCPAYTDIITKLRRILIAAQFHPGVPRQPTPEEIHAIHLAWAQAAA